MQKKKPYRITMAHVEGEVPHPLKHFILSNSQVLYQKFSIDNPFIFNGILIGLCIKGSAKMKINFREHHLEPNTVLVIIANQVVTILDKSEDFFMEYLLISVDFIVNFPLPKDFEILTNIGQFPCTKVPPEIMEDLVDYHAIIIKQYNQVEQFYRVEIVKGILFSMLMEIMAIYTKREETSFTPFSRMEEITNQFFKKLRMNYKEERSVGFYADQLYITSKHLSHVIKQVTGKGILFWVHEAVIVESKMLLKATNMTIAQISDEMHFANPSFFSKFFREHTGMTPMEFREEE